MDEKFENVRQEFRSGRFERLLRKNKNKPDFSKMSPYEIINYLRDRDVRKNYKVLPSNRFFRKMIFTSLFAIFLIIFYTTSGSKDLLQRNLNVFVNRIGVKKEISKILDNRLDYIIQGDFNTLVDTYLLNSGSSLDQDLELSIMLGSISNFSQSKDELLKIKNKLEQGAVNKNSDDYKKILYKLVNNFILINDYDSVKDILDKNRAALGNDILFLEREILYFLLTNNSTEASNIYSSISLENIEDVDSILSYAKLSIIFNNLEKSVDAIDKALSKDIDNINVLGVIDTLVSYDFDKVGEILDSKIESNPDNERLNLIRARAFGNYLSENNRSIEDIDKVIKKHLDKNLPKIIKLDILTYTSRADDTMRLLNEFKNIENKTFDVYYALAKYSLDTKNFNDALNYIKQSIQLNENFGEGYNLLLDILSMQNKSTNINYFYLKSKSLNILNTNIDKDFSIRYSATINDIEKSIDILEFASKISVFESDLKYEIAAIYIDQRKDNEAKEKLNEAIALNERAIYFRTLGVLLIGLGEVDEGISNIRKAYTMDPEDILNLNNAAAYYVNVEKDIQRAFSNMKAAYEGLDESYSEYEAFIIRENYLKLSSIYDEATGNFDDSNIPFIDYLY